MPETPNRMTREEYIRLSDEGYFQDRRVELIDGEIIEMSSQKNPHAIGVSLVQTALQQAFGPNYWAKGQATLNLSPVSLPDPDVAVVAGAIRTHATTAFPTSALLVVEVSETTVAYDQTRKASLYAASGIKDYWILHLIDGQLEVYRNPVPDPTQAFGFGYSQLTILIAGQQVTPLALPGALIEVVDLLP
jgi:Uma2 family endonuclease